MSKKLFLVAPMALILGCGGGGSSGGPAAKQGTVNKQGAQGVLNQTASVKTAVEAGNGESLSNNVIGLGLSGAQQIVSPGASALTLEQAQTTSGTVTCDDTGCVYNKYTTESVNQTIVMDGSVKSSKAGDVTTVAMDLTLKVTTNAQGINQVINYDLNGTIKISPTMIDGSFTCEGTGKLDGVQGAPGGSSISYQYYNQIKYNAVVLSGSSATGGSIYAKWAITISGAPQGNQAWEGTVTFP